MKTNEFYIQANYHTHIQIYCIYKQKKIQLLETSRTQRILLTEALLKESIREQTSSNLKKTGIHQHNVWKFP